MKSMRNIICIAFIVVLTTAIASAQTKSETETQGLTLGAKAPTITLLNQDSLPFNSANALKNGPLLVVFYRGQWCPYCNKHLSAINDSLELLQAKGVTVVAISPEQPTYLRTMVEKTGGGFTFLYDAGYATAKAFDVLFDPGTEVKNRYNQRAKANMAAAHNDSRELLPIPATFLINQQGEVIWRHFEHDYKKRSSVAEILKAL
jgi:peroxiredoxin